MHTTPDSPPMSPALQAFFESLQFHRDINPAGGMAGIDILSVGRQGRRGRAMTAAIDKSTGRMSGMGNVLRYGIHQWTGAPAADSFPEHAEDYDPADMPSLELMELYAKNGSSEPSEDEQRILQANLRMAAAVSPVVKSWAEGLDITALHAFDDVFKNSRNIEKGYNRIVAPSAEGMALRNFVEQYPLLAGVAVLDDDVWEAASWGPRAPLATDCIREHIISHGFRCTPDGQTCRSTGPIPGEILDALRGVGAKGIDKFDNDYIRTVGHALSLARRLPANYLPKEPCGWLGLGAAGHIIRFMEAKRGSTAVALDDGIGLGMTFTDQELAHIFRDASRDLYFGGIAIRNGSLSVSDVAGKIARYGVAMQHRNWMQDYVASSLFAKTDREPIPASIDGFDFNGALQKEIAGQQFIETVAKAEQLHAEFVSASEAGPHSGLGA